MNHVKNAIRNAIKNLSATVVIELNLPSLVIGIFIGILLTITALVVGPFVLWSSAQPAHAATSVSPPADKACVIVINQTQTTWRYAKRAWRGEITRTMARGIPFGLKQVGGDCTPPTTRQQPVS